MLGRYVAGTVLILGVAMVIAPDAPDTSTQVTRLDSPSIALAPAPQTRPATAPADNPPNEIVLTPALAEPAAEMPSASPEVIEAAVEQALQDIPATFDGEIAGIAALAGLEEPIDNVRPDRSGSDGSALMFVAGTRVNVRAGPSTRHEVIDSVAYGEAVEMMAGNGNDWAQIRLPDTGEIGYMARRFLTTDLN